MTSAPAGRPAPLHLAVALDGAGWHPAAWREADAQPQRLFTAGYWTGLAQQAERGLLDFLTIEEHVAKPLHKVKLVFCGTPEFAVPTLRAVLDAAQGGE